jgi:hypothetical protein
MLITIAAVALLLATAGWLVWRYFQPDTNSLRGTALSRTAALAPTFIASAAGSPAPEAGRFATTATTSAAVPGTTAATISTAVSGATATTTSAPATSAEATSTAVPDSESLVVAEGPAPATELSHSIAQTSSQLPETGTPLAAEPAPTSSAATGSDHVALMTTSSPSAGVVYQALPNVPTVILNKIHGHVVVKVRVLLDPTGSVVGQFLESAGPSKYFAHVAQDAAGEWRFAPREGRGSRVSMLRFEFTRAGATAQATPAE